MMRTKRLHARLAYVMRVDNHSSVAYAAASARRRTPGQPYQVHPATIERNPKREVRRLQVFRGPGKHSGVHDAHKATACALSLRDARWQSCGRRVRRGLRA